MDWGLLSVVSAMLIFGIVMVFSASYPFSVLGADHPFYFVGYQLLWIALGIPAMLIAARIPYTVWERWSVWLLGITVISLLVLLVLGIERFGSTRTFLGGSIQPSQPAKIVIVIYIAAWLASKGDRIRDVRYGLLPFSVLLGLLSVLIVLQPSISTAALIVATASIMFFIAGAAWTQLLAVAAGATVTFWLILQYSSYASLRIKNYITHISDPLNSVEHQTQRSVEALTTGGLFGQGIGQGTAQQPGFVPLAWSDNIYAVVGQELGLIGTLLVILLFSLLAYQGLRIAMRCRDPFGSLLALGITTMLVLQALLNMAVVAAVLPPTGVPLPFFTYGGSSLLTAMVAAGLLFSVSRYGRTAGRRVSPDVRPESPDSPSGSPVSLQPTTTRMESDASVDFGWRNGRARVSGARRRSPTTQSSTTQKR
jgi:cell division protein FtsW